MTYARQPSPNFNDRDVPVDMLVLHYTGMRTAGEAMERLCDPAAEVSAHYLIDEDGTVSQLVDEDKRAWHAGVSSWRGETNINSRSIGIEIVNPGHEWGYRDFTPAQYDALIPLCLDILSRHAIPARNVVGHSDVAPARKQDPGEKFQWRRLAGEGIGHWPPPATEPAAETAVPDLLAEIGYDISDVAAAVRAFQRRYRPVRIDGIADSGTRGLLAAVRTLI